MGKHKASRATGNGGPRGEGTPARRSGQGAGSALNEMLRRQTQNPRPGTAQEPPVGSDERNRPPTKGHNPG